MRGMTGDPDEHDDILGFGHTDRAPRAFRLGIRLDRLTLRVTRRPRLVAVAAGLAALALAAGGVVAYPGPAHSVVPSSAAQPLPISNPCPGPSQGKLIAAALAAFLKQLQRHEPSSATSSAYSSSLTVGTVSVRTPTSTIRGGPPIHMHISGCP